MNDSSDKKLENVRNIQFIREFLGTTNLDAQVTSHPRFESILWKLSTLMRRANVQAFSQEAIGLLGSIVVIQADGSISIFENKGVSDCLGSVKYYYDSEANKLRRIRYQDNEKGVETDISTYNADGLEEDLLIEQKCPDGSQYYSHTTRISERIDLVLVERIQERDGKRTRLGNTYQLRTFCPAYEDILPEADEIDPLDMVGLSFLGVPPIYRDLDPEELEIIEACDGEIFPLDDVHKEEQFEDYAERNKLYGRTRRFEEAVANYLAIESRSQSEEQR